MNLHLIFLIFLIKLTFAVNLLDKKSEHKLIRKCNSINGDCNQIKLQTINLQNTLKRVKKSADLNEKSIELNNEQQLNKNQFKKKKLINDDNKFIGKTLAEQIEILNKEVLNRSLKVKKSNENDQEFNKLLKKQITLTDRSDYIKQEKQQFNLNQQFNQKLNEHQLNEHQLNEQQQHDLLHSDKHNQQHQHLNNKNNEYELKKHNQFELNQIIDDDEEEQKNYSGKFNQISEKVFKSLQSLFEIELPNNPTFNEKFIDLIQALIVELNYIKIKLKQANCKMRLSFKSQRIDSDCETNKQEPCNCSNTENEIQKEEETEQQSQFNYHTINNQQISKTTNQSKFENLSSNLNTTIKHNNSTNHTKLDQPIYISNYINNKNLTKPENNTIHLNSTIQATNSTNLTNLTNLNSLNKNNLNISNNNSTINNQTKEQNSLKGKSKKETELSKQLRSAIECFLCKHQWAKCLNVGVKCP